VAELSVLSRFVQKDMLLLRMAAPKKRNLPQFGEIFLLDDNPAEQEMV